MTAYADAHFRARAQQAGAACFLGKPVDAEALAACIATAIG
jgi:FixJ family two-component response regulator